jgi:electron transfer flavoprotein alpha subunit
MAKVLLFVQHENGKVLKGSLCALTAAKSISLIRGGQGPDGDISVVVLGAGSSAVAKEVAGYGIRSVLYSEDPLFATYRAEPYARAVALAAREVGAETVVGLASSTGKDMLPRVAVLLDAGQASDIVGVHPDGTYKRPMYAGNILADVEITTPTHVISVRGTAFDPAQPAGSSAEVRELSLAGDPELHEQPRFGEVVSYEVSKADRPQLTDAEVVVSGGRALGSAEKFQEVLAPLADALNAAIGASRAAVDSGYAPNDWQVGQTGKVVAPNLYIAAGISGAIQHLAGMKDSKVIVAINKSADAPIFEVADYGLVADLFQAVPELTEAIKRTRG